MSAHIYCHVARNFPYSSPFGFSLFGHFFVAPAPKKIVGPSHTKPRRGVSVLPYAKFVSTGGVIMITKLFGMRLAWGLGRGHRGCFVRAGRLFGFQR